MIDPDKVMNWRFEDVPHKYGAMETMLYALGVGLGADPVDAGQLTFVLEDRLRALPTMASILGYPAMWLADPETGIDYLNLVHGEQGVRFHKPLAPEGEVIGRTRITSVIDKGPKVGAFIYMARDVADSASGETLCTLTSTLVCRSDGGFGGPEGPTPKPHAIPERAPDTVCDLPTVPQAALIYRLSGDRNPLHADPAVAQKAGFDAPILHGLCTYGVAGHALLRTLCDYDPARLHCIEGRFSAPVFPGETIRTEIWRDGGEVSFRCSVAARDAVVFINGRAEID